MGKGRREGGKEGGKEGVREKERPQCVEHHPTFPAATVGLFFLKLKVLVLGMAGSSAATTAASSCEVERNLCITELRTYMYDLDWGAEAPWANAPQSRSCD